MSSYEQGQSDMLPPVDRPEQKNSLQKTQQHGSTKTAGLTKMVPQAEIAGTAKGLRSLMQPWRQWVTERTNDDFEVIAFGVAPGTPDNVRDEIGAEIDGFLRPASRQDIAAGLARLKLVTASANISQDDLAMQIAAYADSLQSKPGFAVLWAMRNWHGKFFPCLYDLEKLIEGKSRYVESLSASLNVKQIHRDTRQDWQIEHEKRSKNRADPEHVSEAMARYRANIQPKEKTA